MKTPTHTIHQPDLALRPTSTALSPSPSRPGGLYPPSLSLNFCFIFSYSLPLLIPSSDCSSR
uniref:Uncharacterized protein n=1 Tax=Rhizophora mucronata TaxID=61149 RepID=A0A2P2NGZ0_RHIMU